MTKRLMRQKVRKAEAHARMVAYIRRVVIERVIYDLYSPLPIVRRMSDTRITTSEGSYVAVKR